MALDPISSVVSTVETIIDKIWPDKDEAEKAKVRFAELAQTGQLKELDLLVEQIKVNAVEAAHPSIFVAGWRPFCGWVCGSALAYYYVAQPFLVWLLQVFGVATTMPALDAGELMTVLLGMLGLGAFRSYDKTKGVNGK